MTYLSYNHGEHKAHSNHVDRRRDNGAVTFAVVFSRCVIGVGQILKIGCCLCPPSRFYFLFLQSETVVATVGDTYFIE